MWAHGTLSVRWSWGLPTWSYKNECKNWILTYTTKQGSQVYCSSQSGFAALLRRYSGSPSGENSPLPEMIVVGWLKINKVRFRRQGEDNASWGPQQHKPDFKCKTVKGLDSRRFVGQPGFAAFEKGCSHPPPHPPMCKLSVWGQSYGLLYIYAGKIEMVVFLRLCRVKT